jgi:hypothetical protein
VVVLPCTAQAAAGEGVVLTDLWDSPYRLEDIGRDHPAILFICDIDLSVCREGAVFFDTRAGQIEERGFRAALIFLGRPADVREFALRTQLNLPIYIDSDRSVFNSLLGEKVLPALVLLDPGGRKVRTLYGGGESLEGNISALLQERPEPGRRWWLILIPVVVVAALLPFVLS